MQEAGQAKTRRLFFAICPDEQVKKQLWKLSDDLQFGRRTPIENLHITLVFLGAVNQQQSECLERAASNIQPPQFILQFDRLGYWVRPKTLWAGCTKSPDALFSLVEQLEEASSSCGLLKNKQEQNRDYIPHVSLARKVNSLQGSQYCEQHLVIDVIEWKVNHFSLMESVTYAEGPVYRELQRW